MSTHADRVSANQVRGPANCPDTPQGLLEGERAGMLDLTLTGCQPVVIAVGDHWAIRVVDHVAGIAVNIPLTALALAELVPAEVIRLAA